MQVSTACSSEAGKSIIKALAMSRECLVFSEMDINIPLLEGH